VSVLKGEGKVPILFGSASLSVGTLTHSGYLARPDLAGEWPTVILVSPAWGVTSVVKDWCRKLARRGFAAVAPDLYRGAAPARHVDLDVAAAALDAIPPDRASRDLAAIVDFVANPAAGWSSGEHGFGVLGAGTGGRWAAKLASEENAPLVLAAADVQGVGGISGPMLGLHGRDDEVVPIAEVLAARDLAPHAEWVLYAGVGHDFLDDSRPGFDFEASRDAFERMADFYGNHLPSGPPI
jgi:carboxymethylenebutenolidase